MIARLCLAMLVAALVACSVPRDNGTTPHAVAEPVASANNDTSPRAVTDPAAVAESPSEQKLQPESRTTSPTKAEPGAPGEVDYSCTTDADCTIKNVGNCCGYYPACVNVDSPTFPEQVQAECAASGRASICGFPSLSGCKCVQGQCEGVRTPAPILESEK